MRKDGKVSAPSRTFQRVNRTKEHTILSRIVQRRESPGIEHGRVTAAIQEVPQNWEVPVPLGLGGDEDWRLACEGEGAL